VADADTTGWTVPPSRYIAGRPAEMAVPAPRSFYLPMPDGARLAADVYVHPGRRPTLLIATPYYRRAAQVAGSTAEVAPNIAKYRDAFVSRGYNLVAVDVRGTGASFGTRDSFRSPRERADLAVLADWIVAQDWSDGRIGSTGISYLGAGADFLASTGHKAVRAVAPISAVWDTWRDNYWPGGILLTALVATYERLIRGLDLNRKEMLAGLGTFAEPDYQGPLPVDGDDGSLLAAAIAEHAGNFSQERFMAEFPFRDSALPYDPGFTPDSFSPCGYADRIPEDVAIYSVGGWTDGAGYANGAIARFLTLARNPRHLLIGPWDHGARINCSPWRGRVEPEFDMMAELVRFFDHYLMERDTGLEREASVHVFSQGDERWLAAGDWPVAAGSAAYHLRPDGALGHATAGRTVHATDPRAGTGDATRYERIAGLPVTHPYASWPAEDARRVSWTSAPLDEALALAGHGVVDLTVESSEPDAAIFLYLLDVALDGSVRYVTEGMLRALHRAEVDPPTNQRAAWPFHAATRAKAAPMPAGEAVPMRVVLLPVAWRFPAGHRVRLSLAGGDADHAMAIPHGRPPVLSVDGSSRVVLPVLRSGS
jgi:putative CocE/NonD family hydrolase